jgi:hypothetical protein
MADMGPIAARGSPTTDCLSRFAEGYLWNPPRRSASFVNLSVDDGLCIGLWAAKLHQKYMFARKVVGYTDFKDAL